MFYNIRKNLPLSEKCLIFEDDKDSTKLFALTSKHYGHETSPALTDFYTFCLYVDGTGTDFAYAWREAD